ncbi:MAG: NAD(P)H-binding protein [Armatimonadota bacterium]
MSGSTSPRILLTGATGFVGGRLWPELERAGYRVRGFTRSPEKARRKWPDREWAGGDVSDESSLRNAMDGCYASYYLVHGMAEGGADFRRREVEAAERFRGAAEKAGLSRVIYLGGLKPDGEPTEHLRSRLEVGETLRAGRVPCLELRASMIVGHGSLSWLIVRDLAARLPCMVLPAWLHSRTQPVAAREVILALVEGLRIPLERSASFDLPGPEVLSGREILERTSALMGRRRPVMVEVPVLSPWLSSHWVHFVTRAEWSVAREVVIGLQHDFLARDGRYWELIGLTHRISFDQAVREALAEERGDGPIPGVWGGIERTLSRCWAGRAAA